MPTRKLSPLFVTIWSTIGIVGLVVIGLLGRGIGGSQIRTTSALNEHLPLIISESAVQGAVSVLRWDPAAGKAEQQVVGSVRVNGDEVPGVVVPFTAGQTTVVIPCTSEAAVTVLLRDAISHSVVATAALTVLPASYDCFTR